MNPSLVVFVFAIGAACGQFNGQTGNLQRPRAFLPTLQLQPSQHEAHPLVAYPRILKQEQETQFDGSFNYAYETEDGISSKAVGVLKNPGQKDEAQSIEGSYSYTDKNGEVITITYIADEDGFRPTGAHLPTPPPIPAAIARALDYIRSLPPSDDNKF